LVPLPPRRAGPRPTVLARPHATVAWRQTVPTSTLCLTRVATVTTARSPRERKPLAMPPLSLAVPASAPEEVALCRCVRFARWTRARPLRHLSARKWVRAAVASCRYALSASSTPPTLLQHPSARTQARAAVASCRYVPSASSTPATLLRHPFARTQVRAAVAWFRSGASGRLTLALRLHRHEWSTLARPGRASLRYAPSALSARLTRWSCAPATLRRPTRQATLVAALPVGSGRP
jgi:hypothetical protein